MKVCFVALRNQPLDLYQLETISLTIDTNALPKEKHPSEDIHSELIPDQINHSIGVQDLDLNNSGKRSVISEKLNTYTNRYVLTRKSKNPSFLIPWSYIRFVRVSNSSNQTIIERIVQYDQVVYFHTLENMKFNAGDVILGFTVGKYAVLRDPSSKITQTNLVLSNIHLGKSSSSLQVNSNSIGRSDQIDLKTSTVLKTSHLLKKGCTRRQIITLIQLLKTNTATKDINIDLKIIKEKLKSNRKIIDSLKLQSNLKKDSKRILEAKLTRKSNNLNLLLSERVSREQKLQENKMLLDVLKTSLQQEYSKIVLVQREKILQVSEIYPIRVKYVSTQRDSGLFASTDSTREPILWNSSNSGREHPYFSFRRDSASLRPDSYGHTGQSGSNRIPKYFIKDVGIENKDVYFGMFSELLILTCFYMYIPIKYPIVAKGIFEIMF